MALCVWLLARRGFVCVQPECGCSFCIRQALQQALR